MANLREEYIDHEENTLLVYYVTSYRTSDPLAPSLCPSNVPHSTPAPKYSATGQTVFLDYQRAQTYARLLFRTLTEGARGVKSTKEKTIEMSCDPSLRDPAFVLAALQIYDDPTTSDPSSRRTSKSFHADYPGQKPRLTSGSEMELKVTPMEVATQGKIITAVVVIPMAMTIQDTVASVWKDETKACLGLMKRDIVDEIMTEFRALSRW